MEKIPVFMPQLAAGIAVAVELAAAIFLILGIWTRPVAIMLAVYTLAAAIIGHNY
jgi:putative oxidoreductase